MRELKSLLEMQKAGVFKVDLDAGTMAGRKATKEQLDSVVEQLGWREKYLSNLELINKTDKMLRSFQNLVSGYLRDYGTLEMYNYRKANSIGSYDRIVINFGRKSLTILYDMPNAGGKYVVYDKERSESQPIHKASTLKGIVTYINDNYA
jgi:hypothetical protein